MNVNRRTLRKEISQSATSSERLLEIATLDPVLSREIAELSRLPASALNVLAVSEDAKTRRAVAAHVNVSISILKLLASDKDWLVLQAVAQNAKTPQDIVFNLTYDKRSSVKGAAARRLDSRIYIERFHEVLNDENGDVRICAAHNKTLSQKELLGLLDHPDEYLRMVVINYRRDELNRLLTLEEKLNLITDERPEIKYAVASGFRDWFPESDTYGRELAVKRLAQLRFDTNFLIREYVSWNITDPDALNELASDQEGRVVGAVVVNPHSPGSALHVIVSNMSRKEWKGWGVFHYAQSLVKHPNLSDDDLSALISTEPTCFGVKDHWLLSLAWDYLDPHIVIRLLNEVFRLLQGTSYWAQEEFSELVAQVLALESFGRRMSTLSPDWKAKFSEAARAGLMNFL